MPKSAVYNPSNAGSSSSGKKADQISNVELTVSLQNVRDSDVETLPDPYCVLNVYEAGQYVQHQKTESVRNDANPQFAKKFTLQYRFEERQKLRFDIWDLDKPHSHKGSQKSFLGRMFCTLAEIITANGCKLNKRIWDENRPREDLGTISVSAIEMDTPKEVAVMEWKGVGLDNKDVIGKSDPYFQIQRIDNDNSSTLLYRSETIQDSLNPKWSIFKLALNHLRPGKVSWPLKLVCFDYDDDGKHDLIGECMTSYDEISSSGRRSFELIHPKRGKKAGSLQLCRFTVHPVYTFLDYIRGGTQIHFTVAIDFTVSNKDPKKPNSLHYIDDPKHPNQYQTALKAVGEIVEEYDTDKLFPALGFGARLPNGTISHDFFLNTSSTDPHCKGIEGIMDAYENAIRTVELATPTYFTPIINFVSKYAKEQANGEHYHVLLIITDGEITDYQATKTAIVEASRLPMSIIIIGVGNECRDFSMNMLDSDNKLLKDNQGNVAKRDIVQFVAFRRYAREVKQELVKKKLAIDVLQELPSQLVRWMKMAQIKPRPPLPSYNQVASASMQMIQEDIANVPTRDECAKEIQRIRRLPKQAYKDKDQKFQDYEYLPKTGRPPPEYTPSTSSKSDHHLTSIRNSPRYQVIPPLDEMNPAGVGGQDLISGAAEGVPFSRVTTSSPIHHSSRRREYPPNNEPSNHRPAYNYCHPPEEAMQKLPYSARNPVSTNTFISSSNYDQRQQQQQQQQPPRCHSSYGERSSSPAQYHSYYSDSGGQKEGQRYGQQQDFCQQQLHYQQSSAPHRYAEETTASNSIPFQQQSGRRSERNRSVSPYGRDNNRGGQRHRAPAAGEEQGEEEEQRRREAYAQQPLQQRVQKYLYQM